MHRLGSVQKRTVGMKQSVKAVARGLAALVYVAKDAEEKVRRPVLQACQEQNVPVVEVDTMSQLGKACGIQVGTAVAAILKEE